MPLVDVGTCVGTETASGDFDTSPVWVVVWLRYLVVPLSSYDGRIIVNIAQLQSLPRSLPNWTVLRVLDLQPSAAAAESSRACINRKGSSCCYDLDVAASERPGVIGTCKSASNHAALKVRVRKGV